MIARRRRRDQLRRRNAKRERERRTNRLEKLSVKVKDANTSLVRVLTIVQTHLNEFLQAADQNAEDEEEGSHQRKETAGKERKAIQS